MNPALRPRGHAPLDPPTSGSPGQDPGHGAARQRTSLRLAPRRWLLTRGEYCGKGPPGLSGAPAAVDGRMMALQQCLLVKRRVTALPARVDLNVLVDSPPGIRFRSEPRSMDNLAFQHTEERRRHRASIWPPFPSLDGGDIRDADSAWALRREPSLNQVPGLQQPPEKFRRHFGRP